MRTWYHKYLTACNSDTLQASQCRARGQNSRTCSGSRESYGKSRQKCECEKKANDFERSERIWSV